MHGKTGAKLDSEMSQITRKMKQTTPGEGKKKKNREKKTTQGPRKVLSKVCWHKKAKNQTKQAFFLLDIFQTEYDKNNTDGVGGIKIKPPSVSDCFMNPCRSGGATPHQTL